MALFDILGFSALLTDNSRLERVYTTYDRMKRTFMLLKKRLQQVSNGSPLKTRIFSDTFLIYTDQTNDAMFTRILLMSGALFIAAVENDMKIRGAVAVGDLIVSGDTIIGKPIVEAHSCEEQQDWMGCWITQACIEAVSSETLRKFVSDQPFVEHEMPLKSRWLLEYEIPLKSGTASKCYALNWIEFVRFGLWLKGQPTNGNQLRIETAFLDREQPERWDARRKTCNTVRFREHAISYLLSHADTPTPV